MISIIVPILNEEKTIEKLQNNLKGLDGEFEVIFCDGGSTDRTLELIEPLFQVVQGRKGRGYQMNTGALKAKGDILFFIHCDVVLEKDVLKKIPEKVMQGKAAGCLRIAFDCKHWLMCVCGFMSDMRARFRKIVYGDQGIIIRKDLFIELGMIPELPLMEDLEFSLRLKKQRIPWVRLPSKIKISSRRFEKNGILKTMWQMQKMQFRYLLGENAESVAKEYKNIR